MHNHLELFTTLAQAGTTTSSGPPAIAYWIAGVLVIAGLGLIVVVAMTTMRGRGRPAEEGSGPSEYVEPNYTSVATTQEAERLLRLMGEAEELCTRLGQQLDEKAQNIERLIARSEGRNEGAYGQPTDQPTHSPQPHQQPQPPHAPQPIYTARPAARPEIVTRPMSVPTNAPAPAPLYYGQPAQPSVPAGGAAYAPQYAPVQQAAPAAYQPAPRTGGYAQPGSPQQAAPTGFDTLNDQIFRLADSGVGPAEIAQRLGQHTGKVELILALRNT